MSKKSKVAVAVTAAIPAPAAASQPEILYFWQGNKRSLTGKGPVKVNDLNAGTASAFAAHSATNGNAGFPLGAYAAIAAARGHKGFARYAKKYGWLQPVAAPGSVLAVGPV